MDLKQQKRAARGTLFALLALLVGLLVWSRPRQRISTDILDLVPVDERQPELVLLRSLAANQSGRVALLALDAAGPPERQAAAGAAFVKVLTQSAAFAEVVPMPDRADRDAFGQELFQQRFNLLLPAWLARHRAAYAAAHSPEPWPEWLATQTVGELQAFLNQPEALAFQDLLPADPLLLVPGLTESVKGLDQPTPAGGPILIWARLREPPLTEQGQQPVFAAVQRALHAAQAVAPGIRLRWTSLARFAAASRQRIEGELSTLNLASLLAVVLLAALGLRTLWKSVNLVPVILGSGLVAWTATLLVFPHVHVLVFVVGSLLTGVAIDYGFYLYLQPPAYPDEPYPAKAGRLLRPLAASALTAILGFSLLLFSELPLIRQLGLFVSAGLFGALVVALLWFGQVDHPYLETRSFVRFKPKPSPATRAVARALLIGGALVALVGPWRLAWHDDIRELETPAPALQAEANEIRTLFGERDDRTLFLTHGPAVEQARASLDGFLSWHRRTFPDQPISSAAQFFPNQADWAELARARDELNAFPAALARALTAAGYDAAAFAPFDLAWQAWLASPPASYRATANALAASLHGPMAALFAVSSDGVWFASVAEHRTNQDPPPDLNTVSTNQLENLNQLFSRYRISALHLSLLGLGLVGLSVFGLYGWRQGPGIFAVPLGACFFAFGVLGLMGQTLNLFHLLGAFLGVCLSHNYSIFAAESSARYETQPPSIRLSALTTAASFGVLALSHIPVVVALGSTVSLIVLSALAIVELKGLAKSQMNPELGA